MADEKYLSGEPGTLSRDESYRRQSSVPKNVWEHSGDGDEALKAFADLEGSSLELDKPTSKRLLRVIDRNMMPVC